MSTSNEQAKSTTTNAVNSMYKQISDFIINHKQAEYSLEISLGDKFENYFIDNISKSPFNDVKKMIANKYGVKLLNQKNCTKYFHQNLIYTVVSNDNNVDYRAVQKDMTDYIDISVKSKTSKFIRVKLNQDRAVDIVQFPGLKKYNNIEHSKITTYLYPANSKSMYEQITLSLSEKNNGMCAVSLHCKFTIDNVKAVVNNINTLLTFI
ncbi:MAG: hypothetical protein Faunusvirus31_4 [Faunusvirus sp.]|jgi:hypothetical protein|uniref:Uncharacterized protein n=1 Tax=Faunusvirus sp. TaxID=2487766 RepID=A0A3G4ZZA9_9VIRU|nr:MAG: hypothetical protein Faunusvirus31_4 [Faunusvirus sp.]